MNKDKHEQESVCIFTTIYQRPAYLNGPSIFYIIRTLFSFSFSTSLLLHLHILSSCSFSLLPGLESRRPLLRLGHHPLLALGIELLLPRGPSAEPLLRLLGLEALDSRPPLEHVSHGGMIGAGAGNADFEIQQLVPDVALLGESGEKTFKHGSATLGLAVG